MKTLNTTEESNFSAISTWKNPLFTAPEPNTQDSETVPDMAIPLAQLIKDHTIDPHKHYYEDLGDDDITREEFLRMDIAERQEYQERLTNEMQRHRLALEAKRETTRQEEQSLLKAAREAQEARERSEEQATLSGGKIQSTNPS